MPDPQREPSPVCPAEIAVNGQRLLAEPEGALHWPRERTLVVADLHLEKGSAFATHGRMLPPYDTAQTLMRLQAVLDRLRPDRVICLGDSFHDRRAAERLSREDGAHLRRLIQDRDWLWVAGNHDPAPPVGWGGQVVAEAVIGTLVFRHQARPGAAAEVSGHYHPMAVVHVRGRRIAARCFVGDGRRLILPAFGSYTGGLNVLDREIASLFHGQATAHVLSRSRVHALPTSRLSGR